MPTQEQLDHLKAGLEAEQTLAKVQLQEILGIGSTNTLRQTLKACGLDTAKERYEAEEIWNQLVPARQMLDAGKTYKEVGEHFGMKDAAAGETNEYDANFDEDYAEEVGLTETVGYAAAEAAAKVVERSVDEVMPHVPQYLVHTMKQKFNSPEMKKMIAAETAKI